MSEDQNGTALDLAAESHDTRAELATSELHYVLIPEAALDATKPLSFDLFVRIGEKYIKVFRKGEEPDRSRMATYRERADDVLYIRSFELEQFMDARFGSMYDVVVSNLTLEAKLKTYVRALELCYLDMRLVRLTKDKFMRLDLLVDAGFEFSKKPLVQDALLQTAVETSLSPVARRALLGAVFAISLFSVQNDFTHSTFRSFLVGALFRDIGIPVGIADPHGDPEELSSQQIEHYLKHPDLSVEIMREFISVDDMMEHLMREHHEQPMGNGFPRGKKRAEIFLPAQKLSLADWIVTLLDGCRSPRMTLQKEIVLGKLEAALPEENKRHVLLLTKLITTALK